MRGRESFHHNMLKDSRSRRKQADKGKAGDETMHMFRSDDETMHMFRYWDIDGNPHDLRHYACADYMADRNLATRDQS